MIARAIAAAAAGAGSVVVAGGAGAAAGRAGRAIAAAAPARPPARLLVYAQEWSLWPSRTGVPSGRVIVQLSNRGQDAHDLRIRRLDRHGHMVGPAQGVKLTQSGGLGQASWRLKPGRYELYCSLPGHLRRGMHARVAVR